MRTNVYVDGFNLYYGCLKGSRYRWLDLAALCRIALPQNQIQRIRYFTALVQPRPGHPQQQQNQQVYIRALQTLPGLSVHYGHFLSSTVLMPLANPPVSGPRMVRVQKTEEKGSDVNIATHLLVDCFRNDCEIAVIISNDSDLLGPINVVRKELRLKVGVLSPHSTVSWALKKNSTFYKHIDAGMLAASQLPPTIADQHGRISKPAGW